VGAVGAAAGPNRLAGSERLMNRSIVVDGEPSR
jgi:hypothetical protein